MSVKFSRRGFMMGCSAAIAAMAGSRITHLAFAVGEDNPEILIVLFLRGGWDALNVVMPNVTSTDRSLYEAARPNLKVPTSGTGAALPLDSFFGLHPSTSALYNLYQAQRLAIIHAAGLVFDTRSHFDAMQFMELGTPGSKSGSGWVTRYLESLTLSSSAALPALSAGSSRAASLSGYLEAVALSSPSSFNLGGNAQYRGQQTNALRSMYGSNADWLDSAGKKAIDTIDLIASKSVGTYTPANGAVYPTGGFGDNLKLIAQMMKLGVGMTVATIDLGGWDTHENQGSVAANSYMGTLLSTLSNGLSAFYLDLEGCGNNTDYAAKTTVVVMSEFGRRLRENASIGTDHGHGSVMLVLGKTVKGGQVYGTWPGLGTDQLYQKADLAITTDYRRVLSEILKVRTGRTDAQLATIFPNYTQEQSLGFMHTLTDPLPDLYCTNSSAKKIYLPIIHRK